MDQHYRPQPGTPISELDTPCLILDMDALDHNMGVMADYYAGQSSKLRAHSKNHKTPRSGTRLPGPTWECRFWRVTPAALLFGSAQSTE